MPDRPRTVRTILILSLCLLIAWPFYWQHRVESRVVRLVGGATDVQIKSLRIAGQRRDVVCSRNDLVRYFEDALRHAERCEHFSKWGGVSYQLYLTLDCGGTTRIPIYVGEDGIQLSIRRYAAESGFVTHRIQFESPVPDEIREIMDLLLSSKGTNLGHFSFPKEIVRGR